MKIVLNADDFGYSADTVRATIECFEYGLLTSATIQPGMPATDAAIAFALAHPEYSFGVHLTFVGDGVERPLSPATAVPTLVSGDGTLQRTRALRLRALARRVPADQIEREAIAQIEAVRGAGIPIDHVDSHRHMHKFGPFIAALRSVLPRFGIRRVRTVQDLYLARPFTSPTYWRGSAWRRRIMQDFITTDHFYMPTSAHDEDWQRLVGRLPSLPGHTLEVGVHPGREDEWRYREQAGLAPFVAAAVEAAHGLIGWREVGES